MSGVFHDGLGRLPALDLHHALCTLCGLAFQTPIARRPAYETVNRPTARQLGDYALNSIAQLAQRGVSASSLIYEVGANDGTFLSALRAAGYANTVGVEPSCALAEHARAQGLRIEAGYFTRELAETMLAKFGAPHAVVCRHTLEHVDKPQEFLRAIRRCLEGADDGLLLLEVPDGAAIPELMNVHELWDEHLYCFGIANLTLILQRCGFDVAGVSTWPHLDTRNLLIWCRPAREPTVQLEISSDAATLVRSWLEFKKRWPRYRDAISRDIDGAPSPVYFIGASHAQTNFANYLGVGRSIRAMIDDDPAKLGKHPPVKDGSPAIISTVEFLSKREAGTLVLTGFGYAAWMKRLQEHAQRHSMTIIDPKSYAAV